MWNIYHTFESDIKVMKISRNLFITQSYLDPFLYLINRKTGQRNALFKSGDIPKKDRQKKKGVRESRLLEKTSLTVLDIEFRLGLETSETRMDLNVDRLLWH